MKIIGRAGPLRMAGAVVVLLDQVLAEGGGHPGDVPVERLKIPSVPPGRSGWAPGRSGQEAAGEGVAWAGPRASARFPLIGA